MDCSALVMLAEVSCEAMREEEKEKGEVGVFLCEEARRHYYEVMGRKQKAGVNNDVIRRRGVVQQWREKVRVMNGTAPELMLSKKLTVTDLSHHHSRLLLSYGEVERRLLGTLTPAELQVVNKGLPITMLDKWGEEYRTATFKIWGSNASPVIMGGVWLQIAERSLLEPNDDVDLFAFRIPPTPVAAAEEINNKGKLVLVVSSRLTVEAEERRRKEEPSARAERLARTRQLAKDTRTNKKRRTI